MLLLPNTVYGFIAQKNYFETGLLLNQRLSFTAYKAYITTIVLKLCKNKNQQCSFKATADAADKGK